MLSFNHALSQLINSKEYKIEKDAYLTSALYINNWQINFFSPSTKIPIAFAVNSKIKKEELQKEENNLPKLDKDKIKVDIKEALIKFNELIKEYNESTTQKIIILGSENNEPIWTISSSTSSFKIINIKISASTGKIKENSCKNLIEIR